MTRISHVTLCTLALAAGAFLLAAPVAAQTDFGAGPGCSAIGGVDATTIVPGDMFEGRIGTTAVSGTNPQGKPADNSDADAFTDSLEECINDSLVGFCVDIDRDDSACIRLEEGDTSGAKGNKQEFKITFLGICEGGANDAAPCADDAECGVVEGTCVESLCTTGLVGEACTVDDDCDDVGACVENAICCGISECSDQADNDADTFIDFPDDPECDNYRDDSEAPEV